MNNSEMIETLASQTSESTMTIESILKSYEHYCNKNITRYSSKHLTAIVDFIAAETHLPEETCTNVMTQFFNSVKKQIKHKFF